MVAKIIFIAVLASALALCCGNDEMVSENPQPLPTQNTTAIPTTSQPTTTASTTTSSTTTTATTTTNGTTTTPTTTTKPTTTPSTTTSPPVPPTTASPTTTPKPVPKPDTGNWSVTENNVTCILVTMAVQLNITYNSANKTVKYGIMDVPDNSSGAGSCGHDKQTFNLTWPNVDNTSNTLTLTFEKINTTKHFVISLVNLSVTPTDPDVFPDIEDKNVTQLYSNKSEFSTSLDKSYHCDKEQSIDLMKDGSNNTVATIHISHVHLEAFHKTNDRSFGAAEDCEGGGSSPDIVPIAVGCALVGLVAIVLIAYLVGRRRSQARGYLSM